MGEEVRRLSAFPVTRLVEQAVFAGRISELSLLEHLGAPTAESDPLDADPRIFWDLEFACGLVMAVEFHQLGEDLVVFLDSLDIDHAIRHLGHVVDELVVLPDADAATYRRLEVDEPDRTWSLLIRDVDGEVVILAESLTERDARCREERHLPGDPLGAWAARTA